MLLYEVTEVNVNALEEKGINVGEVSKVYSKKLRVPLKKLLNPTLVNSLYQTD